MFGDKKFVWILQYIFGATIILIVLPMVVRSHPGWSPAHSWAFLLFIAASGIALIDCASSMRLRIELTERVAELEKKIETLSASKNQPDSRVSKKKSTEQQLISSVN